MAGHLQPALDLCASGDGGNALALLAPEDILHELHTVVRPDANVPAAFTEEQARQMRRELQAAKRKVRLTALNGAIKFVRKISTLEDGKPVVLSADITQAGDGWSVPTFVRFGRGQDGDWDLRAIGVQVEWKAVLAQMDDADFEQLWEDHSGVLKVSIDLASPPVPRSPMGDRWWMVRTPDFDVHVWTATKRLSLHPDSKGVMCKKWAGVEDPFTPASSHYGAAWHSANAQRATNFLVGGGGDPAYLEKMRERKDNEDLLVSFLPMPPWEERAALPIAPARHSEGGASGSGLDRQPTAPAGAGGGAPAATAEGDWGRRNRSRQWDEQALDNSWDQAAGGNQQWWSASWWNP